MKRKKGVTLVLLLLTVTILGGCAGFKYGYTKNRAIDSYLLVDEATESFGFKRMKLNQGYNSSLKGFIKEHGLPDFIYEYENEKVTFNAKSKLLLEGKIERKPIIEWIKYQGRFGHLFRPEMDTERIDALQNHTDKIWEHYQTCYL